MIGFTRSSTTWNGQNVSAWAEGLGIHSGATTKVRFHAAPGEPIAFLVDGQRIEPHVDNVVSTTLATELGNCLSGNSTTKLSTVEHLLAALNILGHWSGFVIEVCGNEIPILDGSALGWQSMLGEIAPEPMPQALVPKDTAVEVRGGYVGAEAAPETEAASVIVAIGFSHPKIGEQTWAGDRRHWNDLLDARTFGFARELDRLLAQGRGLGAREDNAIIFDDEGPRLPLRGHDEPVRHKALDLLGDLYLLGKPLQARVWAERASHEAHVALAREILGQ